MLLITHHLFHDKRLLCRTINWCLVRSGRFTSLISNSECNKSKQNKTTYQSHNNKIHFTTRCFLFHKNTSDKTKNNTASGTISRDQSQDASTTDYSNATM